MRHRQSTVNIYRSDCVLLSTIYEQVSSNSVFVCMCSTFVCADAYFAAAVTLVDRLDQMRFRAMYTLGISLSFGGEESTCAVLRTISSL